MKKALFNFVVISCVILAVINLCYVVFDAVLFPVKFKTFVSAAGQEFCIDESLIYSVINVESGFNADAESSSGAIGLMQIMPATAKWIASELNEDYSKEKLYDPETNIRYGSFYLKYLFDKFPDLDTVLACYNAGEGNVSLWINEYGIVDYQLISFKETANYINKVKNNLKIYQLKI